MPSLPDVSVRSWVAIGPASLLDVLVPLRDEHRRVGPAELVPVEPENIERFVNEFRGERTALLVVEDPNAPGFRHRFQSPMLRASGSIIGWLRLEHRELSAYARRAAALLERRRRERPTLVLLAPRERRYVDLLEELEASARSSELVSFRWSAERIRREPLTEALRLGASSVLYTGHGARNGWFAYGGLTAEMIVGAESWNFDETNAVLFSLSCSTGRGFADGIVAGGAAGAVLAPLRDPLHLHSRALAHAIVRALGSRTAALYEILERTERDGGSLDGYAVVGDPAVPVASAVGAERRGAAVFAPAGDAVLAADASWGA